MKTKEILRKETKEKLSSLDEKSFTEMSSLVSKNLNQLLHSLNVIQDKKSIGAFAPIAKEPLWYLDLVFEIEKLTAYPACGPDNDVMTFKMARMSDLVAKKDFGFEILGPPLKSLEVVPQVVLVPGLVFTERGERLGRGKGYYDKYLNPYRGIKIGICFSIQLEDYLPIEKHDVHLDYIVADKKIINCKNAK